MSRNSDSLREELPILQEQGNFSDNTRDQNQTVISISQEDIDIVASNNQFYAAAYAELPVQLARVKPPEERAQTITKSDSDSKTTHLPTDEQLSRMVRDLGGSFNVRDKAQRDLEAAGARALPHLAKALESTDPEILRRARIVINNRIDAVTFEAWLNDRKHPERQKMGGDLARIFWGLEFTSKEETQERIQELQLLTKIVAHPNYDSLVIRNQRLKTIEDSIENLSHRKLKNDVTYVAFATPLGISGVNKTLDGSLLAKLEIFPNLKEIDLSYLDIPDASIAYLPALPKIESVRIHSSTITDSALFYLKRLPNLKSLELSSTNLTDAGLEYLQKFPRLTMIDLCYNKNITDEGLKHLERLTKLRFLDLDENSGVTIAGIKSLKKALPNCIIRLR